MEEFGLKADDVRPFAERETDKTFAKIDAKSLLSHLAGKISVAPRTLRERVSAQMEHLGYVDIADERYSKMLAVFSVDTKFSPRLKMYSLKNGTLLECKIDKRTFNSCKLEKYDIIRVFGQKIRPKSRKLEDGNFEKIPGTSEIWLTEYEKL